MGLFATTLSAQSNQVEFEYDARGRLIQMTNNTGQEVLYTLDDAGNRTDAVIYLSPPAAASTVAPRTQKSPANQSTTLQLAQDANLEVDGYLEDKENEE